MKTRGLILLIFCTVAWGVCYAQTFQMGATYHPIPMRSQQIVQPISHYEGTVYRPFDNTPPSEVGNTYTPGNQNGGQRKGFGQPTDPGIQGEASPIGEPWIMAIFALAFAGVIAWRKRKSIKQQTEK